MSIYDSFLHLGPITIPTFGLMVATAWLVSAYVLQADFQSPPRASSSASGIQRAARTKAFSSLRRGDAGLLGARLYHVLESPSEFFADPWNLLFSRYDLRGSVDSSAASWRWSFWRGAQEFR